VLNRTENIHRRRIEEIIGLKLVYGKKYLTLTRLKEILKNSKWKNKIRK
jgi:hypothetical protein